jgi:hypothetical protein
MLRDLLTQLDYLGILVAAVAGMILGGIWYLPNIMGNAWMAALGRRQWNLGDPRKAILVRGLATLTTSLALAVLMVGGGVTTVGGSLRLGLVVSLGVVVPTIVADYRLAGWPNALTVITATHRFLHVMVMCAVLGVFRVIG